MNRRILLSILTSVVAIAAASTVIAADTGMWPQVMEGKNFTVTMYEPQIDSWMENTFEARAAVSVVEGDAPPVFGAVWISGRFEVDRDTRMVDFFDIEVPTVAFPEASEEQQQALTTFLEGRIPLWDLEIELDRLVPLLENADVAVRDQVELKNAPPEIIIKYVPAVLIILDGEPKFQSIEGSSLERVVNTPYVIVKDKNTYFLATDTLWFEAGAVKGPWRIAGNLPKEVQKVEDELEKQRQEQGAPADEDEEGSDDRVPEIVVSTVPAELLFIDGKPEFEPLQGNDILAVSNTDSDVIFDIGTQDYYVLLSGRWYRTKDLDRGPWSWVANDQVPATFAEIPAESDVGYMRASVAGTEEAREALLEQAVPQTAAVKHSAGASFTVEYDGSPKFQPIDSTGMTYAVNTSASVIFSSGRYYCCDQGVWYESASATGPWQVCKEVPDEIYTIPPSNPLYNVTYVKVYDSTPEVVYVGYTPGYTSSYVSHGCVVYGTGWYYPPYYSPYHYYARPATWGFHVRWNPWYGWSFGLSYSNGPFRISIGFGGWGGGWWGPGRYRPYPRYGYGAGYRAGYRHGYAHGRHAGGGRPAHYGNTNINIYGRPGNSDRVARTQDRAGTRQQPAVARDRANNVYTDKSGNVYRRNDNGSWDRRDKGDWSKVDGVPSAGDRARPETRPSTGTGSSAATRPATRPSTQPSTQPSTRPSTQPSTRPSTGAQPSTRPSTGTRATTSSRPSTSSMNRDYNARQRGSTRSQQYNRGGRSTASRPSGGGRRR